ncbi:hypothetical protein ACFU1R_06690 [Priestia megaterium]|uniref:hypothetical protein n=1 Tax=Priestia megaterium TaxID=1404 RepID=UPI003671D53F
MSENNNNKTNDLFGSVDLSANTFLENNEAKGFDNVFQQPAGADLFSMPAADPFANLNANTAENPFAQPQAQEKKEEPPVVEVKKEEKKEEPPVVPVKKDNKTKPKKNSAVSKAIKNQVKKKEDMKVDKTWTVAYAAQQHNPPEDDMTLDALRQWLELDYPELSKERCRMEVDEEKKLVVPVVSGAKKG